jgi:hypothetical protein
MLKGVKKVEPNIKKEFFIKFNIHIIGKTITTIFIFLKTFK